ncbi:MAG: Uncharacterized protein Athens101410_111 [Parcubacteria group bacterium Athens1014_10]|nr:MAG: Uncharacterized protein Athens101410_111 [Parcubacteria group bacterium Athens1014_10]TSD05920.1 MAG: Uncharacterized protein Athens071412_202 [Parcubacteria group bacterium Athens0714_12]
MQFLVPQFIEIEPKIIGPITARQFIIMLAGGIILVISYKLADFSLFVTEGLMVIFFVYLFGWFKPGGQMFHYFLLNFIQSVFRKPALRIWGKETIKEKEKEEIKLSIKEDIPAELIRKKLISSKLSELSLIVDTGGAYREE